MQANELRTGNIIQSSDCRDCSVTKYEYSQGSGRQLGNVHLELRDVRTGRKTLERLRPYDMIEIVRVDSTPFQFLFQEGDVLTLMHPETYDQITVDSAIFGSQRSLLKEGVDVTVNLLDGEPISGELPPTVTLRVAEAEPYVQGDSATGSLKGATLETGVNVSVPPYVQVDDLIIINTQDLSFVKRAT
ncbi:hypothetical protein WJX73_006232 [Symbiochloris irregularis]|uniref:Elongation factor P n=1 Tax=Symbiochloris irregularis TaxID=706552 RepID=A0AAW1P487_9CHLO